MHFGLRRCQDYIHDQWSAGGQKRSGLILATSLSLTETGNACGHFITQVS